MRHAADAAGGEIESRRTAKLWRPQRTPASVGTAHNPTPERAGAQRREAGEGEAAPHEVALHMRDGRTGAPHLADTAHTPARWCVSNTSASAGGRARASVNDQPPPTATTRSAPSTAWHRCGRAWCRDPRGAAATATAETARTCTRWLARSARSATATVRRRRPRGAQRHRRRASRPRPRRRVRGACSRRAQRGRRTSCPCVIMMVSEKKDMRAL